MHRRAAFVQLFTSLTSPSRRASSDEDTLSVFIISLVFKFNFNTLIIIFIILSSLWIINLHQHYFFTMTPKPNISFSHHNFPHAIRVFPQSLHEINYIYYFYYENDLNFTFTLKNSQIFFLITSYGTFFINHFYFDVFLFSMTPGYFLWLTFFFHLPKRFPIFDVIILEKYKKKTLFMHLKSIYTIFH